MSSSHHFADLFRGMFSLDPGSHFAVVKNDKVKWVHFGGLVDFVGSWVKQGIVCVSLDIVVGSGSMFKFVENGPILYWAVCKVGKGKLSETVKVLVSSDSPTPDPKRFVR